MHVFHITHNPHHSLHTTDHITKEKEMLKMWPHIPLFQFSLDSFRLECPPPPLHQHDPTSVTNNCSIDKSKGHSLVLISAGLSVVFDTGHYSLLLEVFPLLIFQDPILSRALLFTLFFAGSAFPARPHEV